MAYNYVVPFVGIPLNQLDELAELDDPECLALLEELQILCEPVSFDAPTLRAERVLRWFDDNRADLSALGVEFSQRYNGNNDFPMILGVYVDALFPVPSWGAGRFRPEHLGEIQAKLVRFREIYHGLDADIRMLLDRNNLVGLWFNSHSS